MSVSDIVDKFRAEVLPEGRTRIPDRVADAVESAGRELKLPVLPFSSDIKRLAADLPALPLENVLDNLFRNKPSLPKLPGR